MKKKVWGILKKVKIFKTTWMVHSYLYMDPLIIPPNTRCYCWEKKPNPKLTQKTYICLGKSCQFSFKTYHPKEVKTKQIQNSQLLIAKTQNIKYYLQDILDLYLKHTH